MSPLARSLFARSLLALAAAALMHGACADSDSDPLPDDNALDNCARLVIGRRTPEHVRGGANKMPILVTERYGQVSIPPFGLFGPHVVGQYVLLCNKASPVPPVLMPLDGNDSSVFVYLPDGNLGPADMEMTVWYFLEQSYHGAPMRFLS